MSRNFYFALALLQLSCFVHGTGHYSVVGPGTLRSNFKYNAVVSVHKTETPCEIKVGITGPSFNETKTITVQPSSSENVEFDVPKLTDGNYNLTVTGTSGLIFENSTKLNFADDKASVFVQTDKATYKPGDLVQFRVLFLDENTRPAKIEKPITITITDGANNLIKKIKDIELVKGVYTGKLQLSEQPVLGDWMLDIQVDGANVEKKHFEVAKYVLPKFEVSIDTAPDVPVSAGVLKVTVRAKYTYGKSVKGKATVTVEPLHQFYYHNSEKSYKHAKTIDVDGKGHAEFDLFKDLDIEDKRNTRGDSIAFMPTFKVFASMEEALTGNKQNATSQVKLHSQTYKIESINSPQTFKYDEKLKFKVVVKNWDDSPVRDSKVPAKLVLDRPYYHTDFRVSYPGMAGTEMPQMNSIEFEQNLDENGMAEFEVTIPAEKNATYFSVQCQYKDTTTYMSSLSKYVEEFHKDVEALSLTVNTKKPKLGEEISIEVTSKDIIPYFVYTIVGRGKIIKSEYIDVPSGRKSHTFKVQPTFEMVPSATLYIHYVIGDDLFFEETTIDMGQQFENFIDIDVPVQTKPGEDVSLKVKTDPESFVGLLGVDQSVLLLKSGNDLDKSAVFNSLNKYKTNTPWMQGYGRYPGEKAGLVTMTNANYPYNTVRSVPLMYARHFGLSLREYVDLLDMYNYGFSFKPMPRGYSADRYYIVDRAGFNPLSRPRTTTIENPPPTTEKPLMQIRKVFPDLWFIYDYEKYSSFHVPQIVWMKTGQAYNFMESPRLGVGLAAGGMAPNVKHFAMRPQTWQQSQPEIRKEFPENWIFIDKTITEGDSFSLTKKIPDTITSWVITGFSLNPKTGFALTKNPSKIQVFQPFFVSTNLPYSVKRGEVISVPVIIFNYMDKALDAEVTMDNSDNEYDFTEATNEIEEVSIDEVKRVKHLQIPSNTGKSLSFMIRPKKVGAITLKITAVTPLAGDAIHQTLKVEPEGVTKYENKAVFVNLNDKPEHSESFSVDVPKEAVEDSEFIEITVVGDLLGPTVQNLDQLVRMPSGCGEQNMVNFVPNILVMKYLETIKKDMPAVMDRAKKFMEIGYQRELTYKHDDGSYSAFGKSDKAGSTWLTGYVMRSFLQARKYVDIDMRILDKGFEFLASKQAENGSFPEYGRVVDHSHHNELGLTAYVLLAFLEDPMYKSKYEKEISKALDFVIENVQKTDDQYSMAIVAFALKRANHGVADDVVGKLQSLAHEENNRKWWSQEETTSESKQPLYWHSSKDVEITAYVLSAILEKDSAEDSLPVVKYLISKRNSNGGFTSTQDTVVGLYALIKFAEKAGSGSEDMNIDFKAMGEKSEDMGSIKVDKDNALVLQTHVLPQSTRKVDFTAKGKGSSMVQLSYRYNLADKDKKPSFKVTTNVNNELPPEVLVMEVCSEFVPLGDENESNMAVMEIALPSGYTADSDAFDKIEAVDRVKRTETKNSDSVVVVYFDGLPKGEQKCIPVQGTKSHAVAKQKPAAVSMYDYYETDRRATEYYEVKSSLCDICEGDDCGKGCMKS